MIAMLDCWPLLHSDSCGMNPVTMNGECILALNSF
uniref:Uncharacterized protein n=1 Tax=Arundo donax TaxID=35708 RepID=A0A0A9DLG4_ARUDO